jgi:uncharacterized membrane protein
MSNQLHAPPQHVSSERKTPRNRKAILMTTIAIYAIAALLGIISLIASDIDWRIIVATTLIATAAVIILCSQTVFNTDKRKSFRLVTIILAAIAALIAILFIWDLFSSGSYDTVEDSVNSVFSATSINILALAGFFAGTAVLSALLTSASYGLTKRNAIVAYISIGLNILLSLIITILVVDGGDEEREGEELARFLAIVIIVSSLSLLATLALSLTKRNKIDTADHHNSTSENNRISSESLNSLTYRATSKNTDVDSLVKNLLIRDAQNNNPNTL